MAAEEIFVERRGPVAVLTMSNPARRNAFTRDMRRRLAVLLGEFATDRDIRSIVITGADGHFCSGADLNSAMARWPTALENRENMKEVHQLVRQIVGNTRPVISAVEGDAFGAGFSIAMASDLVVASASARFGAAFIKVGLLPDMGILHTLPARIGEARARRLLMSGTPVGADHALEMGLVDELVPAGSALEAAVRIATEMAAGAPMVAAMIKAALAGGINSVEDAMKAELDYQQTLVTSADLKEGVAAFREKRKPRFTGE